MVITEVAVVAMRLLYTMSITPWARSCRFIFIALLLIITKKLTIGYGALSVPL